VKCNCVKKLHICLLFFGGKIIRRKVNTVFAGMCILLLLNVCLMDSCDLANDRFSYVLNISLTTHAPYTCFRFACLVYLSTSGKKNNRFFLSWGWGSGKSEINSSCTCLM